MSVTFSALADPTRRDILNRLRRRPLTVSELAAHYPMSRAAISQHLSVLERAELVSRNRRGQWVDCSITPASLNEAGQWIEQQRTEWDDRLNRLDNYLASQPAPQDEPAREEPSQEQQAQEGDTDDR
ncbi:ArsR/SmtB family transcription factor [Nesterenkonia aurantiaca]|uniref:ArsR/SmtB family transcription factor n=1 Tax=Nesterenkonia aurantiaca TaxID=1436010 RepID=UPI003EE52C1E